jgi:hypothetical protein
MRQMSENSPLLMFIHKFQLAVCLEERGSNFGEYQLDHNDEQANCGADSCSLTGRSVDDDSQLVKSWSKRQSRSGRAKRSHISTTPVKV